MIELYLTDAGHAIDASHNYNLGFHTCSFETEEGKVEGLLNRVRPLGNRMVRVSLYMPDEDVEKYFNVHEDTQVAFVLKDS